MSDLREKLYELGLGCMDGNCAWRRPRGMHTNGGCKCVASEFKDTEFWEALTFDEQRDLAKRRRAVVHGIRHMRNRIEELEAALGEQGGDRG